MTQQAQTSPPAAPPQAGQTFFITAELLGATMSIIENSGTGNTPFNVVAQVLMALQRLQPVDIEGYEKFMKAEAALATPLEEALASARRPAKKNRRPAKKR